MSTEGIHRRAREVGPAADVGRIVALLHAEDRKAVRAAGRVRPAIARGAALIAAALRAGGRLIYVGAGTSGRLGTLDAAECPPTFGSEPSQIVAIIAGGPGALTEAVEGAEDDARAGAKAMRGVSAADVVCGITASGTTPFVLGALRAARRRGARTLLVACNPDAARKVAVTVRISPNTGPELVAGSTRLKAGTATKLVLNALTTAAMVKLGAVDAGRMVRLKPTNAKLTRRAIQIVSDGLGIPAAEAVTRLVAAGSVEGALRG